MLFMITLLCLPLSYNLTVYIGCPFHCQGQARWFGRALYYDWDFTWGQAIRTTCSIGWKKKNRPTASSKEASPIPKDQPNGDAIAEAIQKDGTSITYAELQKQGPSSTPQQDRTKKSPSFPWRRYIINSAFIQEALRMLSRLLYHSRIRHMTLTGTLGLGQPQDTGLLAGTIYALIPADTDDLLFDFTTERYDCTARATGHVYPAIVLVYSAAFAVSRPVRTLLGYWYHTRKGVHHG
jgi:hypothetical protein